MNHLTEILFYLTAALIGGLIGGTFVYFLERTSGRASNEFIPDDEDFDLTPEEEKQIEQRSKKNLREFFAQKG